MKKIILTITPLLMLLQSCASLTSTTYIEAQKSFVLGEGKHGNYSAKVKNISPFETVEVIAADEKTGETTSLGILKPNAQGTYNMGNNTTVKFKNLGKMKATIQIKLFGDSNLSMNYQPN